VRLTAKSKIYGKNIIDQLISWS